MATPNQTSNDENYNVWEENTLDGINCRFDFAEEKISEFEDKAMDTIQSKIYREKKKRNK